MSICIVGRCLYLTQCEVVAMSVSLVDSSIGATHLPVFLPYLRRGATFVTSCLLPRMRKPFQNGLVLK